MTDEHTIVRLLFNAKCYTRLQQNFGITQPRYKMSSDDRKSDFVVIPTEFCSIVLYQDSTVVRSTDQFAERLQLSMTYVGN